MAPSCVKSFSAARIVAHQAGFWLAGHFASPSSSTRRVLLLLFPGAAHVDLGTFNPAFFAAAGIAREPNRAAHRCSKRL
jgi:hypothetical protein